MRDKIYLAIVAVLLATGCSASETERQNNETKTAAGNAALADQVEEEPAPSTSDRSPGRAEGSPESIGPNTSFAPSYDIVGYCVDVSNAVGGSYVIEKGCRDQEYEARDKSRKRDIPDRVSKYCDDVSRSVGGSYVIFNGCVDQELEAAGQL